MNAVDFHIKTKNFITRVLIFYENNMIGEMSLSEKLEDGKMYIGSIPEQFSKNELTLYLLGNQSTFNYCFNEIFNITLEELANIKNEKEKENFVVVNTPSDIKQVILNIPEILAEILKIPTTIILLDAQKSPFKIKLDNMTDMEKKKYGINSSANNFIRYIPMYTEKLNLEAIEFINNLKIKVSCFNICLAAKMYFN